MKPSIFLAIFYFGISLNTIAQDKIEWQKDYQLQLNDFQSNATQIGNTETLFLQGGAGIDFLFSMSSYEFMFTKNFNSKVSNEFTTSAASLVAPDSATAKKLIAFAQYAFDLMELYARKFREQLFEKKGAFSNVDFFRPIYDKLQQEYIERRTAASTTSNLGMKGEILDSLHQEVILEIEELNEFCKECKPKKKRKK